MIIKYIFLLIFTVNGRELREESAVEDALYEELVLKKVMERRFYRYQRNSK